MSQSSISVVEATLNIIRNARREDTLLLTDRRLNGRNKGLLCFFEEIGNKKEIFSVTSTTLMLFYEANLMKYNSTVVRVIDWDTVFRMGHSPTKTVHRMQCTAWIGECPNLKTLSQSMTHDGIGID